MRDLKREVCSAKFEAGPREPLKVLARPLVSEPAKVSEPVRDLNNEACSTNPETAPTEALRALARPFASEAARTNKSVKALMKPLISEEAWDNELDRDLKNDDLSARLKDDPRVATKFATRDLVEELVRLREPLRPLA